MFWSLGLDLHFWRKICKNCKCGKENHDVNDDDIYGWAQFQLLGSKPNKSKKIGKCFIVIVKCKMPWNYFALFEIGCNYS